MVSGFVICGKLRLTLKKCFRVLPNFIRAFKTMVDHKIQTEKLDNFGTIKMTNYLRLGKVKV